ncbi:MAG: hypothetical protein QM642_01830 [Edaphocola sp.]
MKNITIEQLAEKLNGNLWIKGDLKRIYLDEGHNTKKMTTKTFVWQDENGAFKVSCKVECPSQPWEWCKSQEDKVTAYVENQIEAALSDTIYIMADKEGNYLDCAGKKCGLHRSQTYRTQKEAEKELGNCADFDKYVEMPISDFEKEVERLEEIEASMTTFDKLNRGDEISFNKKTYEAVLSEISNSGIHPDKITATIFWDRSGYFRMAKEGEKGFLEIFKELKEKEEKYEEDEEKRRIEFEKKAEAAKALTVENEKKQAVAVPENAVRVKHSKFGLGSVINQGDKTVEVLFDNAEFGFKKMVTAYAKLEIVN